MKIDFPIFQFPVFVLCVQTYTYNWRMFAQKRKGKEIVPI
jgi:hypothetical protein